MGTFSKRAHTVLNCFKRKRKGIRYTVEGGGEKKKFLNLKNRAEGNLNFRRVGLILELFADTVVQCGSSAEVLPLQE